MTEQALDSFDGLLDWPKINDWLQTQEAPGAGPVTSVRQLSGGLQNAVFLLDRGGAELVLRRPSKRAKPAANDTMKREARVLRALRGGAVPHPEFYALCEDVSVTGAAFYLMAPAEGFAKTGDLPGRYGEDNAWRKAMGEELVKAAVALGAVDYEAVGLGDFGKPERWHERQVERWRKQLEDYGQTPGYDPSELAHVNEIGRWLQDNLPSDRRAGIVHGDLQFPNVMFSLQAPKVSAIIDWELASIGDPMLDFGWILSSWWEAGDPDGKKPMVSPWDGFPTRAELTRLYCSLSGRDEASVQWFFALACYKLACLLEGTVAASRAGKVPEAVAKSVRQYSSWLLEKGRQVIAG